MSTSDIIQQIFEDTAFAIVNALDSTKRFVMDLSGAVTGKTMTLKSNHTQDRVLSLPDKSGTLERLEADRETLLLTTFDYSKAEILDISMTHSFTLGITNPVQGKSMMAVVVPNGFVLSLPATCVILSGKFKTNVVNYVYFHCIDGSTPVFTVTIGQQIA